MILRMLAIAMMVTTGPLLAQSGNFQYQLHPDSASVRLILGYDNKRSVQQEIEVLQRLMNDKAFAEFHLGTALLISREGNPDKVASLGIKISPLFQKIPAANDLKARLFKIRQTAKLLGDTLSADNRALLDGIDKEFALYDVNKQRRFSVMLSFPFFLRSADTVGYTFSPVDSSYHYRINRSAEPSFLDVVALSIGYDLWDIGTVAVGGTLSKHPSAIITLSLDVSTPTYVALASFINHIRSYAYQRLPGTPSANGYMY